jgi:hypothetical protein
MRLSPPRWRALISLAAVVPLGFATKYYRGPGAHWANDSLAGLWYEVFWCLAVFFAQPRWSPAAIAGGVCGATCILEFLQLWHPGWLETMRRTFIGAAILGSSFDWFDFLYYFAGSAAGFLLLRGFRTRRPKNDS